MSRHLVSRCISAMILASATLLARPASAAKWVVIGTEPDPAPKRSAYIMSADDAWVFERFDKGFDKADTSKSKNLSATIASNTINSVMVYQVFENAGGTNFILYDLNFKCQQGLFSIPLATSFDRAGKQEKGGSPEWRKVPDNWIGKAEMIACRWKNWQAANRPNAPAAGFAALGMQYLGEANYFDVQDIVNQVWNRLWTDARQPAYYEGTAAEKAASAAKLKALRDQTRGVLTEASKWADIAIKVAKKAERIGGKFAPEMSDVGGMTEAQIIARWGAPASNIESDGVRTLTYQFSDTQYGVGQSRVDIIGAAGKVGETYQPELTTSTRGCSRTLHLQQGGAVEKAWRVFDFDVGCR